MAFRFNIAVDGRTYAIRSKTWHEAFGIAQAIVRDSPMANNVTMDRLGHVTSDSKLPAMRDDETVGAYARRITGAGNVS